MVDVAWAPQPGFQQRFLSCPPEVFELLGEGNRGGGKTDTLLMDFGQHVGQGFGPAWRGIIFRQTYKQLQDLIAKSEKWFPQIFPRGSPHEAVYNRGEHYWKWRTGEVLFFRQFARESDYWNYHGHEYPFVAWEELCNWASDVGYKRMMSTCRSSHREVPRKYRATTNPYGPGHNWVKFRFRLPSWRGRIIKDAVDLDGRPEPWRCALFSSQSENKVLLEADPEYMNRILAGARNEAERRAWMEGSWDIVAGGMFDDVWDQQYNVLPRFEVPDGWRIDRSFDWGSARPFSVGWWAESDGGDLLLPDGRLIATVRGDLFRVNEWYGWNRRPNEGCNMLAVDIAKGIVERELLWGWRGHGPVPRVRPGPADTSIFNVENGSCIATDMAKQVRIGGRVYNGVHWTRADKSPGSRKNGWEQMRKMMKAVRGERVLGPDKQPVLLPNGEEQRLPRERPGLFVQAHCEHFLRTVPVLPRDDKDPDDVDTESEDHVGDETRYRVRKAGARVGSGSTVGLY